MSLKTSHGFSLLEALIASLLVASGVIGLAHLIAAAAVQTFGARQSATALLLAQSKLETLRSLPWRFGLDGHRVSSGELAVSPSTSLIEDREGYVETLDRFGVPSAVEAAHFKRRWAVTPFSGSEPDTLVLQVCVFTLDRAVPGGRANACVWSIRTRKP